MCAVSVIQDYMRQHTRPTQWNRPAWDEYREILRRLELLDTKLGQPDCEDPTKAEWMREVEERLTRLEAEDPPPPPAPPAHRDPTYEARAW